LLLGGGTRGSDTHGQCSAIVDSSVLYCGVTVIVIVFDFTIALGLSGGGVPL
jgi:hypothetical protein